MRIDSHTAIPGPLGDSTIPEIALGVARIKLLIMTSRRTRTWCKATQTQSKQYQSSSSTDVCRWHAYRLLRTTFAVLLTHIHAVFIGKKRVISQTRM